MPPLSAGPLAALPPELFALLEGPSVIHIATRDAKLAPVSTLAFGIQLAGPTQPSEVTVFVPAVLSGAIMANLRDNGQMAVTMVCPTDNRSAQIKGLWLGERRVDDDARARLTRYADELMRVMGLVGIPHSTWRRLLWWPCVALRMEVREVFVQTPGPSAGRRCGAEGAQP
jgi:hypothetical protein